MRRIEPDNEKGYRLVVDATCAANWFADVVRRDIDPMFFVKTGKFGILQGPCADLSTVAGIPEFEAKVKDELPGILGEID